MSTEDAIVHLNAARKALVLEAYHGVDTSNMQAIDHFTVAEELNRIDRAIGQKGESMFARIADRIEDAYTEIRAALACLEAKDQPNA